MDPFFPTLEGERARPSSIAATAAIPLPGQLLLTVPQVARLLGTTPKAIYHRAERGQLPGVVRVGRRLRVRRDRLLQYIEENSVPSPLETGR
ncbi:MAG TPA: helix-turn-helix domain-containing protein [Anaeromyxobacter sp.]|nr:helix-turn-helix domain-containing protein [Anaeromyxobacter sp.]